MPHPPTCYDSILSTPPDALNILEEMGRRQLALLASLKTCRVCGEEKPRSEFPKHSHSHCGFDSRCRDCKNRQTRLRNAWKKDNPPPPPGSICPLCLKPQEKFVADHCHLTNEMRGYVCSPCNTSMGGFDDSPEFLERAAEWIRRGGSVSRPIPNPSIPRHLL